MTAKRVAISELAEELLLDQGHIRTLAETTAPRYARGIDDPTEIDPHWAYRIRMRAVEGGLCDRARIFRQAPPGWTPALTRELPLRTNEHPALVMTTLTPHAEGFAGVVRQLLGDEDGVLDVWDVEQGTNLDSRMIRNALSTWSHDFHRVAVADGNTVRIDTPDGTTTIETLDGHRSSVDIAVWSADDRSLATADASGRIIIWDTDSWKRRGTLRHGDKVVALSWSPTGKFLACIGRSRISVWNLPGGLQVMHHRTDQKIDWGPIATAWSPPEDHIAIGYETGTVVVRSIGVDRQRPVEFTHHKRRVRSLSWSPDGQWLASSGNDGSVCLWGASDGSHLGNFESWPDLRPIVLWSTTGDRVAVASLNYVHVWTHHRSAIGLGHQPRPGEIGLGKDSSQDA